MLVEQQSRDSDSDHDSDRDSDRSVRYVEGIT